MGIECPLEPLPHQKFDKLCERKLKKINRSFPKKFRRARLYVPKQLRFVASDSRLQNRKKLAVTEQNFVMKTVRRCKKSDSLCLMKNLQAIEGGKIQLVELA